MALIESILASPQRTLNGEEADFFYVPVFDQCIITRADDAPHLYNKVKAFLSIERITVKFWYRKKRWSANFKKYLQESEESKFD